MRHLTFPDPTTHLAVHNAKQALQQSIDELDVVNKKIADAEEALQETIAQAQAAIDDLRREQSALEDCVAHTRFYLAPVRTLPLEILRDIFLHCFEDDYCVAWVLAAVSKTWRSLTLTMPKLWSKIRLKTTHTSSPDTVRLWLERSGLNVPLDIEILLSEVVKLPNFSRPVRRIIPPIHSPSPPPILIGGASYPPFTAFPTYNSLYDRDDERDDSVPEQTLITANRNRMHWAHIAFSYLVEQMHRWERFVFRFDTHFPSIDALKTIFAGDAPLLKEFEISAASEAVYTPEWSWLPNLDLTEGKGGVSLSLPNLRSVTLQLVPFRSTSPLFYSGLTSIILCSLSHTPASLDRVLHVLQVNRTTLLNVSLYFREVTRGIIPLTPTTFPSLKELTIGGHQHLAELIDMLTLPALDEFNLDIFSPSVQQIISTLLERSGSPAIKHLSINYGFGYGYTATKTDRFVPELFNGNSRVHSPGWRHILDAMPTLETLKVGDDSSDYLLETLSPPKSSIQLIPHFPPQLTTLPATPTGWVCPNLVEVGIRGFNLQESSASELVRMVELRNPAGGGNGALALNGVTPNRLEVIELFECANVRQEVREWFQTKLDRVVITESQRFNGAFLPSFA